MHTYVCMFVCMYYECMNYVCTYVCVYVFYMYVCIHTFVCVHTNVCRLRPCLATESTNSSHMRTIVTAALQRQYSQTEIIFRKTLVHTYISTYIRTYIRTYIHIHTYTHNTYIHTCTHTHTYIHKYIRIFTHTYVHTYIHTHIHTHTPLYRTVPSIIKPPQTLTAPHPSILLLLSRFLYPSVCI